MEVALRRRLEGVKSVSISQSDESAAVTFEGTHAFSAETVRQALKAADVEVVTMDVDACGSAHQTGEELWLTAGPNRFRLEGAPASRPATRVCVSGRLDQASGSDQIAVTSLRGAATER
jgi:hypothetical protein